LHNCLAKNIKLSYVPQPEPVLLLVAETVTLTGPALVYPAGAGPQKSRKVRPLQLAWQ